MSRVLFVDSAALKPTSEFDNWPSATKTLWDEADTCTRKAATAARWRLRRAEHPEDWPLPSCPLARALCQLELTYRHSSYCRGAVRDS
ncbi:hypothetical protein [Deinococcus humi]|uniref:Uncharacterized protein n=1 Tax=Deinococcus humi TaxID=662880 RepID=A0A7W8JTG8_9DEIO|nr:hypothetical protein [Deinococcus humi]MBB5361359.1 hypothetical protein [Deinococcus humi]